MPEGAPRAEQHYSPETMSRIKAILNEVHENLGDTVNVDEFEDHRLVIYAKHVADMESYWKDEPEEVREELKGLLESM